MQSLCLNVEVLSRCDGMSIEMRDSDEDVFRAAEELGIDLSRREPLRSKRSEVIPAIFKENLRYRQLLRRATYRARHRRRHSAVEPMARSRSPRRSTTARSSQKDGLLLREDLRSDPGLGVLLWQIQASPLQGHHLRARGRRGHPRQGASGADGHRAGRPGHAHLVLQGAEPAWYLLDLAPKDLEKVIYFAAYMITWVDEESRHRDLPSMEARINVERQQIEQRRDASVEERQQKLESDLAEPRRQRCQEDVRRKVREGAEREMKQLRDRAQREIARGVDPVQELAVQVTSRATRCCTARCGTASARTEGGMGAAALQRRLESFDLEGEAESLRETIRTGKGQRKTRARLPWPKAVSAFLNTRNSPMGMVLDCVPVIPPDLRPMVQLDGRFATSDLNDLYRRVINRNNRLKRLLDLGAPEIIVNNEKRMLQRPSTHCSTTAAAAGPSLAPANRPLKSLSDMLKGKQGQFRQNLLGKRRLLRPLGHRGRPAAEAAPVRPAQADGAGAVPAVRDEAAGRPQPCAEHQVRQADGGARAAGRLGRSRRSSPSTVLLNRAPTLQLSSAFAA